ncbi:monocarboxylate transporter 10-like [Montipora capricornis]|uniref:monocarboxylate transporter 10-like n=1 Tax=Montipora capricornis TaxID=246305 RepID=UPI0035F0FE4C
MALGKIRTLFCGKRYKDTLYSWVVCILSAVCNAVSLGFALSFGILFPELIDYFEETRERAAFVGSATLGMVWFASPLAGYLCDRFSCRITTFLGGLLCASGLVTTSFVQSLTHMYFTYSLILGLGACFIYNACYLVIGQYFEKKLSTATGIVALGASLGVLYTGPLLQILLDAFGWRESLRIMTAFYGVICILSLAFNPNVDNNTPNETSLENDSKETKDEEKTGISLYCSVWTFPTFTTAVISFVFASFGMYIVYINLVEFSEEIDITAQEASRLFIFIGLASSIARVITGRLCNEKSVNPVHLNQVSMLIACVATFLLPFSTKYWHLIVFSTAYGLSDGIFITTQCYIPLSCVDIKRRTASFAITNVLYSISAAAGGPIAGLMADKTGNYVYSFYMTGATFFVAFLIPFVLVVLNCKKSRIYPRNAVEKFRTDLKQDLPE